MKKYATSLLIVFLIAACGIVQSGPSQTVQEFYQAVEKGELTAAYDMLSTQSRQMMNNSQSLSPITEQIKKHKGIKSIAIEKEEITGEVATVDIKITYGDGVASAKKESLAKENGKWKLKATK